MGTCPGLRLAAVQFDRPEGPKVEVGVGAGVEVRETIVTCDGEAEMLRTRAVVGLRVAGGHDEFFVRASCLRFASSEKMSAERVGAQWVEIFPRTSEGMGRPEKPRIDRTLASRMPVLDVARLKQSGPGSPEHAVYQGRGGDEALWAAGNEVSRCFTTAPRTSWAKQYGGPNTLQDPKDASYRVGCLRGLSTRAALDQPLPSLPSRPDGSPGREAVLQRRRIAPSDAPSPLALVNTGTMASEYFGAVSRHEVGGAPWMAHIWQSGWPSWERGHPWAIIGSVAAPLDVVLPDIHGPDVGMGMVEGRRATRRSMRQPPEAARGCQLRRVGTQAQMPRASSNAGSKQAGSHHSPTSSTDVCRMSWGKTPTMEGEGGGGSSQRPPAPRKQSPSVLCSALLCCAAAVLLCGAGSEALHVSSHGARPRQPRELARCSASRSDHTRRFGTRSNVSQPGWANPVESAVLDRTVQLVSDVASVADPLSAPSALSPVLPVLVEAAGPSIYDVLFTIYCPIHPVPGMFDATPLTAVSVLDSRVAVLHCTTGLDWLPTVSGPSSPSIRTGQRDASPLVERVSLDRRSPHALPIEGARSRQSKSNTPLVQPDQSQALPRLGSRSLAASATAAEGASDPFPSPGPVKRLRALPCCRYPRECDFPIVLWPVLYLMLCQVATDQEKGYAKVILVARAKMPAHRGVLATNVPAYNSTLPISPTQILAGIRDKGTTRRPESGLKVLDASQRMYGEEKGSHSSQNESPAPVTPLPLGHLIALLRPCTRKQGKENQAKQPHPEPGRIPSNSPTIQKSQHSSKQLCLQTLTPGYPQELDIKLPRELAAQSLPSWITLALSGVLLARVAGASQVRRRKREGLGVLDGEGSSWFKLWGAEGQAKKGNYLGGMVN
ncbi:unnamed protein product [Diplocarpon coronariae]